ncbi:MULTISPECIES: YbaN family protein [unclassified Parabacteroides]|uniref:YbaN family protein n=1 Tax=unclassified Parabacteroides TaxID=2649774 RepID=UPI002473D7EB|nr:MULTISPECIES: YbaN family protein [unclassified Parabacteroides]
MNQTKRIINIVLGSIFLVLGTIGIFLPLLPTTPFWLLTAWFYFRSSERLYKRAMANRYFGSVVKGFMEDKSITRNTKIISLSIMWASAILTSVFLIDKWWIRLLLLLISIGVSWHILSFPTKKTD